MEEALVDEQRIQRPFTNNTPMRITQVMLSKKMGGIERLFVDRCRALAEVGHTVQAICHKHFVGRSALEGVPSMTVSTVVLPEPWNLLTVYAMRRAIRKFRPDVIHADANRAAQLAGIACRNMEIPLIARLPNFRFERPGRMDRYFGRVDYFMATTQQMRRRLVAVGVEESRTFVIPNFSSIEPTAEVKPIARTQGELHLLAYGRFEAKKGFHTLIRALHLVRKRGVEARLTLAGDGSDAAALRQLSQDLNLQDAIDMPGWLQDVTPALDSADVFILPSISEPFGIVVLEAMARGIPIISTRTEGPSEVLDASTALLIDIDDVDALANAIAQVASDPQAAHSRAQRALQRYRTTYYKDRVVKQLCELYANLASKGALSMNSTTHPKPVSIQK